jgi:hypothetical protein
MKVYVVIERTGNDHEVDGAIIHAIYRDPEAARATATVIGEYTMVEEFDLL